jgi:hypothetical protein
MSSEQFIASLRDELMTAAHALIEDRVSDDAASEDLVEAHPHRQANTSGD